MELGHVCIRKRDLVSFKVVVVKLPERENKATYTFIRHWIDFVR